MTEPRTTLILIVGRAVVAGILAGGVTGMVIGTGIFPIVGTCLGAAIGAMAGAGLGMVNGAALAALSRRTSRRWAFAITAGVICGVGAALVLGGWQAVSTAGWQPRALVAWCIALGIVLGPAVVRARGRSGRRPGPTRIGMFAAYGAAGAAVVGSVAGLAVGLVVYAPTAPFALIEGALLASPPGALIGALAAFVPTRRQAVA